MAYASALLRDPARTYREIDLAGRTATADGPALVQLLYEELGQALRVVSDESRNTRLMEAEKKAAALRGEGMALFRKNVADGMREAAESLKDAGVDMTTDEPLQLTLKQMNLVMDQMEAILAKKK